MLHTSQCISMHFNTSLFNLQAFSDQGSCHLAREGTRCFLRHCCVFAKCSSPPEKNQKAGRLPRKYLTKEKWPFETQESAESLVKQLSQTKVNNSNILVGRQMGLIPFWEKGWPEASDNFWANVNSIEKLWNKVKSECRKSVKLRICVRCILFHPLIYSVIFDRIRSHSPHPPPLRLF